jgi:hypothetical protein
LIIIPHYFLLKIYGPIKHTQNKIVKIDNNEVSFIATTSFGIGVSDNYGLTGCSINTPVVFSDKSINYEGLVKMVKNIIVSVVSLINLEVDYVDIKINVF